MKKTAKITRERLARRLREPGLSYRDASVYINVVIETISEALSKGESIQLRDLGSFEIKTTPAKKYPSLRSGARTIPAHGRIVFKPCARLRKAVWNYVN